MMMTIVITLESRRWHQEAVPRHRSSRCRTARVRAACGQRSTSSRCVERVRKKMSERESVCVCVCVCVGTEEEGRERKRKRAERQYSIPGKTYPGYRFTSAVVSSSWPMKSTTSNSPEAGFVTSIIRDSILFFVSTVGRTSKYRYDCSSVICTTSVGRIACKIFAADF